MIGVDETAIICDFAETYRIYDYKALPARYAATLACGLKADSRIKSKMAGVNLSPPNVFLFGLIVDELRALRYMLGSDKDNKPVFVTEIMEKGIEEPENRGYNSGADFEKARERIIARLNNA